MEQQTTATQDDGLGFGPTIQKDDGLGFVAQKQSTRIVEIPGYGDVEFPASMSDIAFNLRKSGLGISAGVKGALGGIVGPAKS